MKYHQILALLAATLVSTSALAAEHVVVKVDGLACQFCAQGLEKKLSKEPNYSEIKVDMKEKTVAFISKEKVDDEKITQIILDAGYKVAPPIQHHPIP